MAFKHHENSRKKLNLMDLTNFDRIFKYINILNIVQIYIQLTASIKSYVKLSLEQLVEIGKNYFDQIFVREIKIKL